MKSEPDECSVDDALAAPRATVPWTGVRNYQARNFMRDRMKIGDGVLFCHSGVEQPGIAGLAEVASFQAAMAVFLCCCIVSYGYFLSVKVDNPS